MRWSDIYIICYDISDDRRRNAVFNILKNYGFRIQNSVFECNLNKENSQKLINELQEIIDDNEDSLNIYNLCEKCESKIITIGIEKKIDSKTDTIII